jgi:hypothetical protein
MWRVPAHEYLCDWASTRYEWPALSINSTVSTAGDARDTTMRLRFFWGAMGLVTSIRFSLQGLAVCYTRGHQKIHHLSHLRLLSHKSRVMTP